MAVILDADVLATPQQVTAAIQKAHDTGRMTLAFAEYKGLTPHMTSELMRGYAGSWDKGVRFRSRHHESSIVAVPRKLWDVVGGFDERFVGWGQEDVAFAQACRVLGGELQRIPGDVWHLWHPNSPERRKGLPSYKAAQALGQRYRETRTKKAMRALLAERERPVSDRERVFSDIYERNAWNGRTEGMAGPGSTRIATKTLREWLPKVVADLGALSVLDAGCGDAGWMPDLPGYIGVDIVPTAIETSRRHHVRRTYRQLDVVTDDLPKTDVVFCRDAMQHMSLADAQATLENFRRSARWLIASSHRGGPNRNIPTGGWHAINLQASPFSLGEPEIVLSDGMWDDGMRWPTKIIGVWTL